MTLARSLPQPFRKSSTPGATASFSQSVSGAAYITYTCKGPRGGRIRHGILQLNQLKSD